MKGEEYDYQDAVDPLTVRAIGWALASSEELLPTVIVATTTNNIVLLRDPQGHGPDRPWFWALWKERSGHDADTMVKMIFTQYEREWYRIIGGPEVVTLGNGLFVGSQSVYADFYYDICLRPLLDAIGVPLEPLQSMDRPGTPPSLLSPAVLRSRPTGSGPTFHSMEVTA